MMTATRGTGCFCETGRYGVPMDPLNVTTQGDPAAILQTAGGALSQLGYTVTPDGSGWAGRAEVGSSAGRVLLGGFSRRMILDYSITQGLAEGQWQLIVAPGMTGASGGLIGVNKAKKEMASVATTITEALRTAGQLAIG